MASARRTAQALHPTNLHVNAKLFPRDTIQSRLPDPEWLERWLDASKLGKIVPPLLQYDGSCLPKPWSFLTLSIPRVGEQVMCGSALVRGDEVIMAHHDTQVKTGDHAIVFVTDKKTLPKVEKLFQVGVGFL